MNIFNSSAQSKLTIDSRGRRFKKFESQIQSYITSHVDLVDQADVSDPQTVAEYAADIHTHLKATESLNSAKPGFMERQEDIN